MTDGIVYVATDEKYISQAKRSASRIKKLGDWPITLLTDDVREYPEFDEVKSFSPVYDGFGDKPSALRDLPYDRTIYLDGDTYVVDRAGIDDIFSMLDRFDFVAALDTGRFLDDQYDRDDLPDPDIPPSFQWFNGGVLGFDRSDSVRAMIEQWFDIHKNHMSYFEDISDQASLRVATYNSDIHLGTLPTEYNYRIPWEQTIRGDVEIVHGHASNPGEVARFANKSRDSQQTTIDHLRVESDGWYHPVEISLGTLEKKVRVAAASLRRDGLQKTLSRIRKTVLR